MSADLFQKGHQKPHVWGHRKWHFLLLDDSSFIMPRKQGLIRRHKNGTGNNKGCKRGRTRPNVAHPKPAHLLTPLKPNDSVAPTIVTPASGQTKLLGMNYSSGRRFLQNGMAKPQLLTRGENNVSWSRVQQRKGFSKITPEIREKLND